ncbi:MAG TPA: DNA translocase FtsK 4TM domain-containing protein [Acidimicrobiia bacterium]|nr:DNA translocase FtsK 4TM domain-containing protein [Acidimicrobiia bacterium]
MPATKTRRGTSSRSKSSGRRSGTARGRTPARRKKVTSPAPGVVARSRDAAGRQLAGHWSDLFAVCLFVLGAIFALGLWTDLAGPVGSGLADGTGAVLGRARVAVPVACFAFGVVLLWPRRGELVDLRDDAGDDAGAAGAVGEPPTLRIAIGALLLFVADVGILHLAYGRPSLGGNLDDLRHAGGALGAMVAGPLVAAIGVVGASVVLGAVAVVGVLLVLGLSIGVVVGATARASKTAAVKARSSLKLAPIGEGVDLDPPPPHVGPPPFDYSQYEDDEPHPEPEPEPPAIAATAAAASAASAIEMSVVEDPSGQLVIDLGDDAVPHARAGGPWKLPPANLLKRGNGREADRRLIDEGGRILEATLAHHGVEARLVGTTVGPTVTRYELELGSGVKVNRVTGLSNDIQYAMASLDVRILAPIPGRSAVGVEVPNKERIIVTLGDVLGAPEAQKAKAALGVGLGRDIAGKSVILDVTTLPHVLIAGATGAGKSSCINSIVTSLLMRYTPDQVRLILVDPKRVELGAYNNLPHLLTEVVTSPKKAANALDWAVREMDMRYELLAEVGVRDITGYNSMFDRGELPTKDDPDPTTGKGYERLPFIVIVVDELNDLMMVAARDVEASICRIAQMARAVGIHLIIATQRPSVDVITGVIKANVPSRMAFSVSSLADSRVVLDQPGAEKLIGQGDMLVMTASSSRAQRVQGSWVDEECVRKVAAHWKRQASTPVYVDGIADEDPSAGGGAAGGAADDGGDELLGEAMELVVRSGLGSTSMLQRKLRVGFARAGRLMDLLERRGVVGPSEGSKARAVLMTVEEFEARGDAA